MIDADGNKTDLTTLSWTSATSGWSTVKKNKNIDGGTLKVNGVSYSKGLGVNSNSVIIYDLPKDHKFVKFEALCGYDSDMNSAPNGVTMEFMVFTQDPAPNKSEVMSLDLRSLGFAEGEMCKITDMWSGKEIGTFSDDQHSTIFISP